MPQRAAHLRQENTRDRALEVALELFSTQGYEKTSLREIADALGITKAALYYHFPSKDALLVTLVLPFLDRTDELLERTGLRVSRRGRDARHQLLESYLDLLIEQRAVIALLAADVSATAHSEIGQRLSDQQRRLRQVLAGGADDKRAEVFAVCALGAVNGGAAMYADGQLAEVRELILKAAMSLLRAGR